MLLYHRGLGTNGEMDAALDEEAGFKTWMANNSQLDTPATDSPTIAADPKTNAGAVADMLGGAPVTTDAVTKLGNEQAGNASHAHDQPARSSLASTSTGARTENVNGDPATIGGVRTAELDRAIQAMLGVCAFLDPN